MTFQPLAPVWVIAVLAVPALAGATACLLRAGPALRTAWIRRLLMVVLVTVMALGPSIPHRTDRTYSSNVEVYFVVDRTGSMAALDYDGDSPRLAGVSADMISLTGDLPASKYSIISFDSRSSRDLGLTSDSRAVDSWAQTVTQELSDTSIGSNFGRVLTTLERNLSRAATERPGNVRLVYFMTDGENTDGQQAPSFADLAQYIDGGAVLGYGTTEGGRMRTFEGGDPTATTAPWILDPSRGTDVPAVSRIDPDALKTLASQLGVPYTHRTEPGPTTSLTSGIDSEAVAAESRRPMVVYRYLLWPLAIALGLLLAWEAWFFAGGAPFPRRGAGTSRRHRPAPESVGTVFGDRSGP